MAGFAEFCVPVMHTPYDKFRFKFNPSLQWIKANDLQIQSIIEEYIKKTPLSQPETSEPKKVFLHK